MERGRGKSKNVHGYFFNKKVKQKGVVECSWGRSCRTSLVFPPFQWEAESWFYLPILNRQTQRKRQVFFTRVFFLKKSYLLWILTWTCTSDWVRFYWFLGWNGVRAPAVKASNPLLSSAKGFLVKSWALEWNVVGNWTRERVHVTCASPSQKAGAFLLKKKGTSILLFSLV